MIFSQSETFYHNMRQLPKHVIPSDWMINEFLQNYTFCCDELISSG